MAQDLRWLGTFVTRPGRSLYVWTLQRNGRTIGYAPYFVHPSRVECSVGGVRLLSKRVSRLDGHGSPTFDRRLKDDEQISCLKSLLGAIRTNLQNDEVVFLQCVKEHTALHRALKTSDIRRSFHVIAYGNPNPHRLIRLPETYEAYGANLGSKTRADLKRTRRRLMSHLKGDVATRCFESRDDVVDFIADAMQVSSRTWQYHLHESGLRDRDELIERYSLTAELGWFRSYILYARGRPIAFQVGHVYGNAFVAEEIGYDPDWRKFQVGIFLHTEILKDLLARAERPKWFDFGPTDNGHKRRLSTNSYREEYYYLLPRHVTGTALASALRTTIGLTEVSRRLLKELNLLEPMMKVLDRRWRL